MFITKSTTADEILVPPQIYGINLRSLIVSADVDNTLTLKAGIGGRVLYVQRVIAGDNRGFITNFPVIKIGSEVPIVVSLASANLVNIFYDY